MSLGLSGGFIKNLLKNQETIQLKVNDTFYLKNFKGIRNIGYHYDEHKQAAGLNGENLGFDRYLNFSGKFSMVESALLSSLNIDPFVHVNLALAPNRNISESEKRSWSPITFIKNYGRAAVGFGASL